MPFRVESGHTAGNALADTLGTPRWLLGGVGWAQLQSIRAGGAASGFLKLRWRPEEPIENIPNQDVLGRPCRICSLGLSVLALGM